MPSREEAIAPIAAHWIRPIGFGLSLFGLLMLGLCLWWVRDLLQEFARLWRQAPIVETVYPIFAMPAAVPGMLVLMVAGMHGLLLGRVLTSESGLWFKAMQRLGRITMLLLIYLTPVLAIGTTIALKALDYRTCSELRVSGSAWQVFWVNTDAYCFAPDSFINGNWPCREINNKKICLQADGR